MVFLEVREQPGLCLMVDLVRLTSSLRRVFDTPRTLAVSFAVADRASINALSFRAWIDVAIAFWFECYQLD